MGAYQLCDGYNNSFRIRKLTDSSALDYSEADYTDENCGRHRNHNPSNRYSAGNLKLFRVLNSHKAEKYMRHTEVSKPPSEGRYDSNCAVRLSRRFGRIMSSGKAYKARKRLYICNNLIPASGSIYAVKQNHNKRNGHHDTLNKICR